MISETFNIDCIEGMKQYPDKYFDLAVVDPPYGIDITKFSLNGRGGNDYIERHNLKNKSWDILRPNKEYWDELFRVSKNQIVWGANYFTNFLPITKSWIYWDKMNDGFTTTFASGELAWTSFNVNMKQIRFKNQGNFIGFENNITTKTSSKYLTKIHHTEKPYPVYIWLYNQFTKEGMKILDTHLGSQSSRIAAYKSKLDFIGFEIDKEYFEQGNQRFEEFKIEFEQEIGTEKILKNQHRLF
jgi:site-specific DNA-methyltransferase (adenine-specific)